MSIEFQQKLQPKAGPGRRAGQWPDLLTGSPSSKEELLVLDPMSSEVESSREKLPECSPLLSFLSSRRGKPMSPPSFPTTTGGIKSMMNALLVDELSSEEDRSALG